MVPEDPTQFLATVSSKLFHTFWSLTSGLGCIMIINRVEKRPWILRAQKGVVHNAGVGDGDEQDTWPDTLIYVSCGWEAFKAVRRNLSNPCGGFVDGGRC